MVFSLPLEVDKIAAEVLFKSTETVLFNPFTGIFKYTDGKFPNLLGKYLGNSVEIFDTVFCFTCTESENQLME